LQAAEKVEFPTPSPQRAVDFKGLAVSLKRYLDTNLEFFRSLPGLDFR